MESSAAFAGFGRDRSATTSSLGVLGNPAGGDTVYFTSVLLAAVFPDALLPCGAVQLASVRHAEMASVDVTDSAYQRNRAIADPPQ